MKQNRKAKNTTKPKFSLTERWYKLFSGKISMIIMLLTIVITFLANYNAMFDPKLDMNGDNIHYFSLGKAISEGKGFTNIMYLNETPHTHFPPGYPFFVAGILSVFPDNINAVKVANGILLLLSLLLLFVILDKITKNRIIAFLSVLLCSVHHTLLLWGTIMMSEMLFLFCSFVIIYLLLILDERKLFDFSKGKLINNFLLVLLLLFFSYIYFVRTIGLSLIISVFLWCFYNGASGFFDWMKSWKNKEITKQRFSKGYFIHSFLLFLLLLTTFWIAKSAWDYRNEKIGKTESDYVGDFYMKPNGEKMSSFDDWLTRAKNNTGAYITKYVPNSVFMISFDKNKEIETSHWIKGLLIIALMLLGLLGIKKAGLLFFLYIGITMGVLVIFPEQYSGERYYIGIVPIYIFLALNGLSELVKIGGRYYRKSFNPFMVQSLVVILFSAFILFPAYIHAQEIPRKFSKLTSWDMTGNLDIKNYYDAIEWCGENLSDSARVICRKPEIYYIHSGYHKASGFPKYADPDTILNYLINIQATHIIIDNWYRHAYQTLYPTVLKYQEKFSIVKKFGEVDNVKQINPCVVFRFNNDWGYFGERVNGKKEGKGYLVFKDGRKYVGVFSDNTITGYGELYDAKGKIIEKGYWEDGILIKKQ